jgi:hypothetical protein
MSIIERKRPVASIVLATLVAMQVGLGCSTEGPEEGVSSTPDASAAVQGVVTFSGEELVAGIFFGQGPAAKRLPDQWQKQFAEQVHDASATSPKAASLQMLTYADLAEKAGASVETVKNLRETANKLKLANLSELEFKKAADQALQGDLAQKRVAAILKLVASHDTKLMATFADDVQSGDRVRVRVGLDRMRQAIAEVVVNDPENLPNADVVVDVETAIYAVVAVAVFAVAVAVVFVGVNDKLARLEQDIFVDGVAEGFQTAF